MTFNPYLFYSGTCREAFTRYQEIFGGELFLMPMSEVPGGEGMPGASPDTIIHAALTLPDGSLLMASDDPTGDGGPMTGMSVSHMVKGVDDAHRAFDALSEGGEVTQALTETFFSPAFGMCVDRFGVRWMVNAEAPEGATTGG